MAQKNFWDNDAAAAEGSAAPGERKANAAASSAEGSAASSQASAHETTVLLPPKLRKETAQADVAEIAAQTAREKVSKAELNKRMAALRGQEDTLNILTNIQQARGKIGPLSMGLPGQVLQNIWGTDAKDLHATLTAIMGPAVIEKLGQMKAQSASGSSGFGALSEKELQLIKSSIAAIGQDQSSDQLQENLNRLEEHYRKFQAYNAGVDPGTPEGAHAAGLAPSAEAEDAGGKITNEGKWKYDPKHAGMNSTIAAMVDAGRTADQIREYADTVDPGLGQRLQHIDEAIADRRKTKRPMDVDVEREFVPQTDETKKKVGSIMNSAPGAFAAGSADAYTSGYADEGAAAAGQGTQAGNEAVFRGMSEEHPTAYTLGGMAGSLAQYATLRGLAGKYLSPGATEMFQNASYGAGSAGPGNRITGAATGAATGFAGDKLVKGAVRIPSTMLHGPEDKGIRLLTEKYVPTTIGQTLGGGAKSLEDKMTSWPMIGPHIKQRRREAFEGFNRAAFNDALEPIGGKAEGIGEEGVAKAQKAVSQAYTDALAGTTLMRDPAFDAAITTHIPNIRGIRRVGPEVADEIEKLVRESFDPATGTISGEAFQASLAELRQLKRSYRGDPLFGSRIGPELTKVENELTGLFERQVPDKAADFANANKAYRHVSILGDAVDNASAGADGIFTPAQLRAKSRANTKLYSGKNASARGDRPFYELDKAGRANLPSSIPDSGTGERLLLPAALGVLAGGGTIGAEAADDEKGINLTTPVINTLGASLLGRMPYSKMSQALVRKALSGPRSPTAQMLGDLGNKYLAPGVAALTRPLYSDALIDRTPNPKVPYVPAGVPEGAPPEAETPALPPGMHIDPATGQIVPDEAPTGMAYGGAVRRLAQKYACGGPVRRYG